MSSSIAYTKTDCLLNVKNVNLFLEGNHILRDINLQILDINRPGMVQGQIFGLISKSGAGKTQTLKCISGLYNPRENNKPNSFAYMTGEVLLGKEAKPVALGDIGFVQQNYPLWNHLNVQDNLILAGHKLPKGERKDKAEAYMNHFGLWEHKNMYPKQLSGGQKQRCSIAQSFLNAQHIVCLDEPYSGLDVSMIQRVSEMILSTANLDEKNSVLIISHDIRNTLAICDTIALLGSDKDISGNIIPGSTINPGNIYDLIELDFAWHSDLNKNLHFQDFCNLITYRVKSL